MHAKPNGRVGLPGTAVEAGVLAQIGEDLVQMPWIELHRNRASVEIQEEAGLGETLALAELAGEQLHPGGQVERGGLHLIAA